MSLRSFQLALKTLYTASETQEALDSPEQLAQFITGTDLTEAEKQSILSQPQPRLQQYRFMLFSNVLEVLSDIFPYTALCLGTAWEKLVAQYFYAVPPNSYQLLDVGKQFVPFVSCHEPLLKSMPYLAHLAMFEWLELELLNAPNPVYPQAITLPYPTNAADFYGTAPVLNEVYYLLVSDFDLIDIIDVLDARKDPTAPIPTFTPEQTYLWVYRSPLAPFYCRFFKLNMMMATFLSTAADHQNDNPPWTTAQILQTVLDALDQDISFDTAAEGLLPILAQLHENDILLGSYEVK